LSLVCDSGAMLLNMNPDRNMTGKLRQTVEGEDDKLVDFQLLRLGSRQLGAIIAVITSQPREVNFHKNRLARFTSLSHLTVEVTPKS